MATLFSWLSWAKITSSASFNGLTTDLNLSVLNSNPALYHHLLPHLQQIHQVLTCFIPSTSWQRVLNWILMCIIYRASLLLNLASWYKFPSKLILNAFLQQQAILLFLSFFSSHLGNKELERLWSVRMWFFVMYDFSGEKFLSLAGLIPSWECLELESHSEEKTMVYKDFSNNIT